MKVLRTTPPNSELDIRCEMDIDFKALRSQVETSLERRTLEPYKLFSVLTGSLTCTLLARVLELLQHKVVVPLTLRIRLHFSTHIFHAMARLDVPTFADPMVQGQLDSTPSSRGPFSSVSWELIHTLSGCIVGLLKLTSQAAVLFDVLHDKPDGLLLAILSFGPSALNWFSHMTTKSGGKQTPYRCPHFRFIANFRRMGSYDKRSGLYKMAWVEETGV
jgi:hypothetical protein